MRSFSAKAVRNRLAAACAFVALLASGSGCHDGPMYALKKVNPLYSQGQWKADRRLGITDAQRAEELRGLVASISTMPVQEQQYWLGHLDKIMANDESGYMRALAIQAAGRATVPESMTVIETGLDDDDFKVRMASASVLSARRDPKAVELLAKTIGSETNKDVKLTAIKSLASHRGQQVNDALKIALQEPDLAYQHAAIASLKEITGKDVGSEPTQWIAYLDAPDSVTTEQQPEAFNPLKGLF